MSVRISGVVAGAAVIVALMVSGDAATSVVTLSVGGRASANVSLAASGTFVAAVWSASAPGGETDIYAAASRDGGRSFSSPVRVNSIPGDARVNGEQPPRLALKDRAGLPPRSLWSGPRKGPPAPNCSARRPLTADGPSRSLSSQAATRQAIEAGKPLVSGLEGGSFRSGSITGNWRLRSRFRWRPSTTMKTVLPRCRRIRVFPGTEWRWRSCRSSMSRRSTEASHPGGDRRGVLLLQDGPGRWSGQQSLPCVETRLRRQHARHCFHRFKRWRQVVRRAGPCERRQMANRRVSRRRPHDGGRQAGHGARRLAVCRH